MKQKAKQEEQQKNTDTKQMKYTQNSTQKQKNKPTR